MTESTPASRGYPIKLVRDQTTAIINESGEPGDLFYDCLPRGERDPWLRRKLMEECSEYLIEPGVNELADILAVVEGLAALHGLPLSELVDLAAADPRGGFLTGRIMRGYHAEFDGRQEAA